MRTTKHAKVFVLYCLVVPEGNKETCAKAEREDDALGQARHAACLRGAPQCKVSTTVSVKHEHFSTAVVSLGDLSPAADYLYRVMVDGGPQPVGVCLATR